MADFAGSCFELNPIVKELVSTQVCFPNIQLLVDKIVIVDFSAIESSGSSEAYRLYLTDKEETIQAVVKCRMQRFISDCRIHEGSIIVLRKYQLAKGKCLMSGGGSVVHLVISDLYPVGEELRWDLKSPSNHYFGDVTTIPEEERKSKNIWMIFHTYEGGHILYLDDREHHVRNSEWNFQRSAKLMDVQTADNAVGFLRECDGVPQEPSEFNSHDRILSPSPDAPKKKESDVGLRDKSDENPNPLFRPYNLRDRFPARNYDASITGYDYPEARKTEQSHEPGVMDNDPHNTGDFLLPRSPEWLRLAQAEHHLRCHNASKVQNQVEQPSSLDDSNRLSTLSCEDSCPSISPYAYRAMMLGKPLLPIARPQIELSNLASITGENASNESVVDVLAVIISVDQFTFKRSRMPLKRDIRLADPSTSRRIVLSVFTDAVNFTPTVGTVALFRGVTTHKWHGGHLCAYESQCLGRDWFLPNPVCVLSRGCVAAMEKFWEEDRTEIERGELRKAQRESKAMQKDLDDKLIAYMGGKKFDVLHSAFWSNEAGALHGDWDEIKRAQRLGLVEEPTRADRRKRDMSGHLLTEPPHNRCRCRRRYLSTYGQR